MAEASPNFALITEQDLEDLIDAADSQNTKKQIQYAVNRLSDFAKYKKTSFAAVEAFTTSELDSFLSLFYASLRKQKDGATLYTKKSMQAIRYGLMRHFLKSKGFNICKDVEFDGSNKTFKAMLVKLKDAGKGWVKRKSRISTKDMAKIQA